MRPSEIYPTHTRDEILTYIREQGYRVIDFRPPRNGDRYFIRSGIIPIIFENINNINLTALYQGIGGERLILEKI